MGFFKRNRVELPVSMMVVGLGNPGAEYRGTRHNVGFDVVDLLSQRHKIPVKTSRDHALTGQGSLGSTGILLVKPLTYMNLSGRSVKALADRYKIPAERILVIADDLDLPVGKVRLREKGSSGGHNGHKSIIASLGTELYPRLKIGIGKGGETRDHVLSRFHSDERALIDQAVARCADVVEKWVDDGMAAAMRAANESE